MEDVEPTVSRDLIRQVLFGNNDDVRNEFVKRFGPGIDNFVIFMDKASRAIAGMETQVPNERAAWTYNFLFIAFNNLLTSFHLQISGMMTPSGNLMRQYGECVVLALLCSRSDLPDFDNLMRLKGNFPVHKALNRLKSPKTRKIVGIGDQDWNQFHELIRFYDKLSHPTFIAAGATVVFESREGRVLGGAFDSAKLQFYEDELRQAHAAARRLISTTELCLRNLNGGVSAIEEQRKGE